MRPPFSRREDTLPALAALAAVCCLLPATAQPSAPTALRSPGAAPPAPVTLEFKDFFEATPRELRPTARLTGMNGRRIHMAGFMAKLDAPITGAFYLCPVPTFGDEEGGGTADLPPQAVRVLVSSYRGRPMPYVPGPVSVTGVLHIGPVPVENGQISMLQLTLDRPAPLKARAPKPPLMTAAKRTTTRK